MYWSEDTLVRQNFIASIMSRIRFEMIGAALHLKDDTSDIDNNLVKNCTFYE